MKGANRVVKKCVVLLDVFLGCCVLIPPASFSVGKHDKELWTWVSVSKDLEDYGFPDDFKLVLDYHHRWDKDVEHIFQRNHTIGLQFPLPYAEGWTLTPNFRYIDYDPAANETRYYFDLQKTWKEIADTRWDLKYRMRFDIRDIHDTTTLSYRLRHLLDLSHPLSIEFRGGPAKFYTLGEIFYDTAPDPNRLTRYRVGSGLRFPVSKEVEWTVGYQMEAVYRSGPHAWDYDNNLMTGISLKF